MSDLLSDDTQASLSYQALFTDLIQRSGATDVHFPFSFSGLDYAVMLLSSSHVPDDLKEELHHTLCWSHAPAACQLDDNVRVFLKVARDLMLRGLGGSEESRLIVQGSLQLSCLQQDIGCLSHHITVQRWLAGILTPPPSSFDPAALRDQSPTVRPAPTVDDETSTVCCPSCKNAQLNAVIRQSNELRQRLMAIRAQVSSQESPSNWSLLAKELQGPP
ncbi:Hypothetical protein, putative [Bodo saltans]|uniref:Uncharacterized protein n=1 Tax=Bodo saltans TaxID=75058 RepID=A0A0S4INH4_BODSA|nr:Hypothetical protein, putative [Bodo saltans]|eukprot:CUE78698.1 Hypothetical protein, putative [Bodo saltans]